jgi:hypothetical protein
MSRPLVLGVNTTGNRCEAFAFVTRAPLAFPKIRRNFTLDDISLLNKHLRVLSKNEGILLANSGESKIAPRVWLL